MENTTFHPKIQNRNKSVFVNQKLEWDDTDTFEIPESLIKGIKDTLNWAKPSRIQSVAIPLMLKRDDEEEGTTAKSSERYESLIAQAKNGAGKTGAFVIGSLIRVDPKIKGT